MKLNTRELTGTSLLIAYHMAEGFRFQFGAPEKLPPHAKEPCKVGPWMCSPEGYNTCLSCDHLFAPSMDVLMLSHKIGVEYPRDGVWVASIWTAESGKGYVTAWAEGPKTAALRCYTAYKLGDEIEIADAILEALK